MIVQRPFSLLLLIDFFSVCCFVQLLCVNNTKIGMYYGIFDPPTQADNVVIRAMMKTLALKRLYITHRNTSSFHSLTTPMLQRMFHDLKERVIVLCLSKQPHKTKCNKELYKKRILMSNSTDYYTKMFMQLHDIYCGIIMLHMTCHHNNTSIKELVYAHETTTPSSVLLEMLFLSLYTNLIYGYVHLTRRCIPGTVKFYRIFLMIFWLLLFSGQCSAHHMLHAAQQSATLNRLTLHIFFAESKVE